MWKPVGFSSVFAMFLQSWSRFQISQICKTPSNPFCTHLMAAVRSNWADRPGSDPALSSDEEDFVSSHSTASLESDNGLGMNCLSTPLSKVHLDQTAASSHSSEESSSTPTSTSLTAPDIYDAIAPKLNKPLKLLELPLDILKVIVKEVCAVSRVHPSASSPLLLWIRYV